MTAPTCSLSAGELAAQLDRYHALGRAAAEVENATGRVVVRFSEEPPAALLKQTIEVERGCCPFLDLDYDPEARRLTVTADDVEHRAGLDTLAQALKRGRATDSLPSTVASDDPTRRGCCTSTALAVCCDPQDKRTCCGEATTAPPARCGCRA